MNRPCTIRPCCGAGIDRSERKDPAGRKRSRDPAAGWEDDDASGAGRHVRTSTDPGRPGKDIEPDIRHPPPVTEVRTCIAESYRDYRGQIGELPGRLADQGTTLHARRNLLKTLVITSPGREAIEVVVKAFAVPAMLRGFVYAYLRESKARRSMTNAQKLRELGVGTPDPVACIEYRDRVCLRHAYYVCRFWPHDYDLTALLYCGISHGSDTQVLLEQLARFTLALHDHGVLHRDYNPGNILVRSRAEKFDFSVVDLNRLRFKPMEMNDRISGLVRLTNSIDYLRVIGRCYARMHGADPKDFCRRLEAQQRRFVARRRRAKKLMSLFR